MKHIKKNESPKEFEEWKEQGDFKYKDLMGETKKQVRKSLTEEQGYICCYCGKKIDISHNTIIEHFLPKNEHAYPHLQLEYENLHASCDGGQSKRAEDNRHLAENKEAVVENVYPSSCDSSKNDSIIEISPLNEECEEHFDFTRDGEIIGKNEKAINAISILGLDNSVLKRERKAVIDALLFKPIFIGNRQIYKPKEWNELEEELKEIYNKDQNGMFKPYCFAVKKVCESLVKLKEISM